MPAPSDSGATRGGRLGPTVAGSWYPAERDALERELDRLLSNPAPSRAAPGRREIPDTGVAALIVPHAGYVYSGAVAAAGFLTLREATFTRVVLLGPTHYAAFHGAAVPAAASYRTPLGDVPLDSSTTARLGSLPGFRVSDDPFLPEHSLEAEIPFLQRLLRPGWRLVPVLIGGSGVGDTNRRVVSGLRPLLDPEALVVVSSDFTHYGPRFRYVPFTDEVPRRLEELDLNAADRILEHDAPGFADYVARTGATICGRNAIDVLLRLLPPATDSSLAAYDTSGRMTGDWGHSVSYASLVFRRPTDAT